MLTLQTNKLNILGRLFALLIIAGLHYLIIKKIIDGQKAHEKNIGILFFLVCMLTYVFLGIVSSFFQVLKVRVNKLSGEIILSRLFSTLTIYKDEITGYYTTVYKGSTAKPWRGLLVKTANRKSFRLTGQNLKSIEELKIFFEQENLKYLGEKKPFFSQ
ncbi:MAG TPA: hypothetical protein VGG71_05830 [Chitinophagaceae bacterium]|jgi:hypothetical protein